MAVARTHPASSHRRPRRRRGLAARGAPHRAPRTAPRRLGDERAATPCARLGFLQLDPIATVATAAGARPLEPARGATTATSSTACCGRSERCSSGTRSSGRSSRCPLVRGADPPLADARPATPTSAGCASSSPRTPRFRRYVLRELERRGPLPGRALQDRAKGDAESHRWYGSRRVGLMLESLHLRGEIAVAGRHGRQRLWDLAERVYPASEAMTVREAEQRLRRAAVAHAGGPPRGRALGRAPRQAPADPVPDRADAPLALRPARLRPRPRRGSLGLPLPPRDVRPAGEARVRLLRAAAARRRSARGSRRAGARSAGGRAAGDRRLGRHRPGRRGAQLAGARSSARSSSVDRHGGQPTTSGSFVNVVRRSQPSSVTSTRSSIRTPTSPSR